MGLDGGTSAASREVLRLPAWWSLNVCCAAGEASGAFIRSAARRDYVPRGAAADPDRSAREAARRARSKLRLYCAANRLNRLGTLTYAGDGCHDPVQVRSDAGEFFRALRDQLGGDPFAYVWVPEWHPGGHGLHLHFAVGRFVPRGEIARAWGRGFVHIKLLGGLPVGSGPLAEARVAAGYLSKYVAKSFTQSDSQSRPAGLHRYELAEGFTPQRVRLRGRSDADVLRQAMDMFGGAFPERVWVSGSKPDWAGPPAVWAQWRG